MAWGAEEGVVAGDEAASSEVGFDSLFGLFDGPSSGSPPWAHVKKKEKRVRGHLSLRYSNIASIYDKL